MRPVIGLTKKEQALILVCNSLLIQAVLIELPILETLDTIRTPMFASRILHEDIKTLVKSEDTSSGSAGEALKPRSAITGSIEPKSRTATEQPLIDSNVTFRSNSSTRTLVSDVEARAEDLIPPYNALKIAAMNEYDNDNEEGDAADADMEEPIGNELMIMEEDDLLGEDLVTFKSPDMEANIQNILESSILMIEANQNADKDEADEDAAEKTVTRTSSFAANQC
ncbi:hypothetical protein Bca4012_098741 [Brassica carinata]